MSDEPVDDDWFTAWREGAERVSKEQMQRLWAKALIGELRSPGSYSLHSMEFLRRMSPRDANLIAKVAPFRIDNVLFREGQALPSVRGSA